jgi:hypothetical protein
VTKNLKRRAQGPAQPVPGPAADSVPRAVAAGPLEFHLEPCHPLYRSLSIFDIEVQHFDIEVQHFDIKATKKLRYRSFFDVEAACYDIGAQT